MVFADPALLSNQYRQRLDEDGKPAIANVLQGRFFLSSGAASAGLASREPLKKALKESTVSDRVVDTDACRLGRRGPPGAEPGADEK